MSFSNIHIDSLKPHLLSLLQAQKMRNIKHKGSGLNNTSAEHKILSVCKINFGFVFFLNCYPNKFLPCLGSNTSYSIKFFGHNRYFQYCQVTLRFPFSSPFCSSLGVSAVYPVSKVFLLLFRQHLSNLRPLPQLFLDTESYYGDF